MKKKAPKKKAVAKTKATISARTRSANKMSAKTMPEMAAKTQTKRGPKFGNFGGGATDVLMLPSTPVLPSNPGRARVNIIFHGLFAFIHIKGLFIKPSYEVWIPANVRNMPLHFHLFGNPLDYLDLINPQPLNSFTDPLYSFTGVQPAKKDPKLNANEVLLIDGGQLRSQGQSIAHKISFPTPDVIRLYRGIESSTANFSTGDPNTADVLQSNPPLVHDVVVFSYFIDPNAPAPQLQTGGNGVYTLRSRNGVYDLCIYSETAIPYPGQNHSMLFNNMFQIKSGDGGSQSVPLNVDLHFDTQSDGAAPTSSAVGIQTMELMSLSELVGLPASVPFTVPQRLRPQIVPPSPMRQLTATCGDGSSCTFGIISPMPDVGT